MTRTLDEAVNHARELRAAAWEAERKAASAELAAYLMRHPDATPETVQAFLAARLYAAHDALLGSLDLSPEWPAIRPDEWRERVQGCAPGGSRATPGPRRADS